jgi:hypothetical protein
MNLTNHFNIRWVERIVGITTEKEIKEYIAQNREMISEHANKTFEHAQFIYKGQIGDNVTRNYHIKDDIIFISNTSNDALITCYKIDLGFTSELNSTVRKGLIKEIQRLSEEKDEIEFNILVDVEAKEQELSTLDDNIAIMEEQLLNLKKQKEFKKKEVSNAKSQSLNVGLELRKYTLMLVNSKDYKSDLLSMK